jgi:hypothetical protein
VWARSQKKIHSHSSTLQGNTALSLFYALGFSIFTSRILATDLSQSHCHFKPHVKFSCHGRTHFLPLFCSCHTPKTLLDYSRPPFSTPTVQYSFLSSRAEQSSSLMPATSQHGHSWHRAPLGPMAIYLFSVKIYVVFFFFRPSSFDKKGGVGLFYNWSFLTTPYSTRGHIKVVPT